MNETFAFLLPKPELHNPPIKEGRVEGRDAGSPPPLISHCVLMNVNIFPAPPTTRGLVGPQALPASPHHHQIKHSSTLPSSLCAPPHTHTYHYFLSSLLLWLPGFCCSLCVSPQHVCSSVNANRWTSPVLSLNASSAAIRAKIWKEKPPKNQTKATTYFGHQVCGGYVQNLPPISLSLSLSPSLSPPMNI